MISKWLQLPGCVAALLLLWALAISCTGPSAPKGPSQVAAHDKKTGIWCKVDQADAQFCDRAKAVLSSGGGVLLVGFDNHASLMIEIPRLQLGAVSLKDPLKARLDFSRSIYSSQSSEHFAANAGTAKSRLEVTVDRIDKAVQLVEGRFSAAALSSDGGRVELTEGKFLLTIAHGKPEKRPETVGR